MRTSQSVGRFQSKSKTISISWFLALLGILKTIRFTLGAAVNTRVSQSLFEIPDAAAAGANVNLLAGKLGMKLVGKL